jgi:hypothetical protein
VRRISLFIAVLLILSQATAPSCATASEGCGLNPPLRAESASFRQLCGTFCLALSLYKLDAIEGTQKGAIIRDYGRAFLGGDIRFDLEKMGAGRKGWTRCYPVTVAGKPFIVRVFLTREVSYQPRLPVLCEIRIDDPEVTCQVLPPVNEIIAPLRIAPAPSPSRSPADISV